ncbi:hypothetical protein BDV97DRAFT_363271 [Delphinella strobiligena]|nr:hypothetical protein BDV97DRAFT_363271 [Delphinella strobiligena]
MHLVVLTDAQRERMSGDEGGCDGVKMGLRWFWMELRWFWTGLRCIGDMLLLLLF